MQSIINTRLLTNGSPSSPNLTPEKSIMMLRQGESETTRYSYYHNTPNAGIRNRTNDIFNHFLEAKGGAWTESLINKKYITAASRGGILPLQPHPEYKKAGNSGGSNPVPVAESFADFPTKNRISHLVDTRPAQQVNPISVPATSHPYPKTINLLSPNQYRNY